MKIRKNGMGISIFNCYRHLRMVSELESELEAKFIEEISELTQEQIDEMVQMAEEEDPEEDDTIPY